jgi:hypothetical protein
MPVAVSRQQQAVSTQAVDVPGGEASRHMQTLCTVLTAACVDVQNGAGPPPAQPPAAGGGSAPQEPDLTKEQPGDEGYLAAVRAAMDQLGTGGGAAAGPPPAAAGSAGAAPAPAAAAAEQAGGAGANAGSSSSEAAVRLGPELPALQSERYERMRPDQPIVCFMTMW